MTKVNKIFEIKVWYRYVIAGEQEKDYQFHNIEAETVQEAVNKAADMYNSHRAIPFSYEHEGQKFTPTNFTKEDLFNLTAPISCTQQL